MCSRRGLKTLSVAICVSLDLLFFFHFLFQLFVIMEECCPPSSSLYILCICFVQLILNSNDVVNLLKDVIARKL